jgi:hypothetical protein
LVYTALSSPKEFRLNSKTGQITLVGKLDYETRKYYAIVVQAESPSETGKAGLTTVVIHVTDINDNAPVIDDYPKDPIHVDVVMFEIFTTYPWSVAYEKYTCGIGTITCDSHMIHM